MVVFMFVFFFFKQKTAYEMRISDWSSDVCSSDLQDGSGQSCSPGDGRGGNPTPESRRRRTRNRCGSSDAGSRIRQDEREPRSIRPRSRRDSAQALSGLPRRSPQSRRRSEEHTSELQSLMRISYAVFCLKTKNNKHQPCANTPIL